MGEMRWVDHMSRRAEFMAADARAEGREARPQPRGGLQPESTGKLGYPKQVSTRVQWCFFVRFMAVWSLVAPYTLPGYLATYPGSPGTLAMYY